MIFSWLARRECNLPENAVIITLVAHFLHSTLKGAEILVDAAAQLPPDVLVLLVGDPGPDRSRYQRENIRLLGPINDSRFLRIVYAASDMIAVPSHEDNLPNVLLEAMAMGVPVIGANVGGIPDVVQHGGNGWIVPTNDREQWVAALKGAISDVKVDSGRCAFKPIDTMKCLNKFVPDRRWLCGRVCSAAAIRRAEAYEF